MGSADKKVTGRLPRRKMNIAAQLLSFNRALALDRVAGDEELLREIAQVYLGEYPEAVEEIRQAVEAGDAERLHRAAHALKGSLGTLGAEAAQSLALELETMGRYGRLHGAEQAVRGLREALSAFHLELAALTGS